MMARLMHAVVELKVSDGKFGVADVIVQRIEFGLIEPAIHCKFGVEPLECLEILPLQGVIERLTEVEVLQVTGRSRKGGKSQGKA